MTTITIIDISNHLFQVVNPITFDIEDYFLFLGNTGYLSIIALIIGIYYAKKSIKLHQKNSPFKE